MKSKNSKIETIKKNEKGLPSQNQPPKDIEINWNIIRTILIAWVGSLLAAITLRLAVFRIILPIFVIILVIYLGYCTWKWFAETMKIDDVSDFKKEV